MPYYPAPRLAVALLFLMNGFMVGSWAAAIPYLKNKLALGESQVGLLILVLGLGALVVMPLNGWLMRRFGSRFMMLRQGLILTFGLVPIWAASEVWMLIVPLFVIGGLIGGMDVAMNANAVVVERFMKRSIMSSFHGFWSLGAVLGMGLGTVINSNFGLRGQALIATILALSLVLTAWTRAMDGQETQQSSADGALQRFGLPQALIVLALGVTALFSMIPEGATLDWAALYLRQTFGTSALVGGFGLIFLQLAMALVRFGGDFVRDALGAVPTMRISAALAMTGMLLVTISPGAWLALIGFALLGLGVANLVPIAFSAAGNLPGLSAGTGITFVTVMGYSGLLVAPPGFGFAVEHFGYRPVWGFLVFLLLYVLLTARMMRFADIKS